MRLIKNSFTWLAGAIFIVSAITKLISVEYFEQFIYSFGVVTLKQSILFTRILIAVELSLGLLFLIRLYLKWVCYISIAMLVAFTLFIVYLELFNKSGDCYCFGTVFQLSNTASIIKNVILILLTFLVLYLNNIPSLLSKFQHAQLGVIVFLSVGVSIAVNFPNEIKSGKGRADFCRPCLTRFIQNTKLQHQKKLICFFSTKCKYCQLSAKRISTMALKAHNTSQVLYVFWDNEHHPTSFFTKTESIHFRYLEMNVLEFLDLTKGVMPLIVLYDNGKVVRSYRYADMDEAAVLDFLGRRE